MLSDICNMSYIISHRPTKTSIGRLVVTLLSHSNHSGGYFSLPCYNGMLIIEVTMIKLCFDQSYKHTPCIVRFLSQALVIEKRY